MDLGTTLVAMSPFLMVVAIVGLVVWVSSANRRMTQETVREAIRAGQTLDAETIKALGVKPKDDRNGDLRSGAILCAVALAIIALGWAIASVETGGDADEALPIMFAIAAFPGFIGIVLLMFGLAKKKEQPEAIEG